MAGLIQRARRLALRYAPRAIKTLAELLDHPDGHVRRAAAEGLLDRAGLKPYSLEPERLEVVHSVDVDALRAQLAARVEGLRRAEVEVPPGGPLLPEEGVTACSQGDGGTEPLQVTPPGDKGPPPEAAGPVAGGGTS